MEAQRVTSHLGVPRVVVFLNLGKRHALQRGVTTENGTEVHCGLELGADLQPAALVPDDGTLEDGLRGYRVHRVKRGLWLTISDRDHLRKPKPRWKPRTTTWKRRFLSILEYSVSGGFVNGVNLSRGGRTATVVG